MGADSNDAPLSAMQGLRRGGVAIGAALAFLPDGGAGFQASAAAAVMRGLADRAHAAGVAIPSPTVKMAIIPIAACGAPVFSSGTKQRAM